MSVRGPASRNRDSGFPSHPTHLRKHIVAFLLSTATPMQRMHLQAKAETRHRILSSTVQPPLATLPTVLPFSLLWEWNGQERTKDPCDRQTGKQPPEAYCSSQSLSVSLENWKATQLVEQQESPKEECSVMVNR